MSEERDKSLERLRDPFPPEVVGKLPRVTCKQCSDRNVDCSKHQKKDCAVCGNWISTSHIHLDYVGHAEVTDRLLSADPEWNWEPAAFDVDSQLLAAAIATGNPEIVEMVIQASPPKFDRDNNGRPVGLWIKLTISGVTRRGFGSVMPGAFDAEKQLIGDAMRNASMRFGVALDLWAKSDLESSITDDGEDKPTTVPTPDVTTVRPPPNARVADEDGVVIAVDDPQALADAKAGLREVVNLHPPANRNELNTELTKRYGAPASRTLEQVKSATDFAAGWVAPAAEQGSMV